MLEQTWLIITSDHGESFGEHAGDFLPRHESLSDRAARSAPGHSARGARPSEVVKETVSLRDLAATIVDVAGLAAGSPFPGASLARFWRGPAGRHRPGSCPLHPCSPRSVPNDPAHRDSWGVPGQLPPLGALKRDDWSYIRREGDAREELFHLREDPGEQRDLAGDPPRGRPSRRCGRRWSG